MEMKERRSRTINIYIHVRIRPKAKKASLPSVNLANVNLMCRKTILKPFRNG